MLGLLIVMINFVFVFCMQITAIDIDQAGYNLGLEFMKKAGVDHKINFIQSDAVRGLDQLLNGVRKLVTNN